LAFALRSALRLNRRPPRTAGVSREPTDTRSAPVPPQVGHRTDPGTARRLLALRLRGLGPTLRWDRPLQPTRAWLLTYRLSPKEILFSVAATKLQAIN
jgi:hypothetical protein